MSITWQKYFPGKLPHDVLQDLLQRYAMADDRTILGARLGEDATAIDMGDKILLAKTDPITFTSADAGYYAVHVNANDIYCLGGRPQWFLATLLLPEYNTTPELVESLFARIHATCQAEGIAYCGGHTEVTLGLERPIVIGHMLGEVFKDRLIDKRSIQPGDRLILAREAPLEATALIARARSEELARHYGDEFVERSKNLLIDPGISIRPLYEIVRQHTGVHGLHDPTEGGVWTAIVELCRAADLGIVVQEENIPILPEGKLICDHFGLDPLGCLASGSLLIAVAAPTAAALIAAYANAGICAADIGGFSAATKTPLVQSAEGVRRLHPLEQDEIVRILH